jgi:tetratricopeptide (TPR) repeat protein
MKEIPTMAEKKISRKKLLKEPDEFITTTGKVIKFLQENRRQITVYGIIAAAVIAAGILVYTYFHWQEGKALTIQQQGLQMYQEAYSQTGNIEKEKENFKKALEKFKEAWGVYPRGNTGQISQIYIGNCHYAVQEFDAAIQAFSLCLEGPFRYIAAQSAGYCYEAKGDYAKAIENFQRNAEGNPNPYQEEGLLGVARCYEALNQKPKALETYQKALSKNPNSKMAEFIQWKVGELKG